MIFLHHASASWAHNRPEFSGENSAFRTLLDNAIRWTASPDAMAWAKKNPKRIFRN